MYRPINTLQCFAALFESKLHLGPGAKASPKWYNMVCFLEIPLTHFGNGNSSSGNKANFVLLQCKLFLHLLASFKIYSHKVVIVVTICARKEHIK